METRKSFVVINTEFARLHMIYFVYLWMFQKYLSVLQGATPVVVQSFWRHVVRYWLMHVVVWLLVAGAGSVFVLYQVDDVYMQQLYGKATVAVNQLYMSGLEIAYDPSSWVVTNMSWPVVRTMEQIMEVAKIDPWMIDTEMNWWTTNFLTIDTTATIEDFPSYDTIMLVTQKYLIVQSNTEMRIVPFVSDQSTTSTGIVITKELLTELSTEWATWIATHGDEIRRTLVYILWGGGLLLLPFLALGMVARLSVGMLLVTLVSWWLSKVWVRVSYRQLFTWLSLSYLPVYLFLKTLMWIQVIPSIWIIGYIAMVGCLAVYIVRHEQAPTEETVAK